MHCDELAAKFNLSPRTIQNYVRLGIIPPPTGKRSKYDGQNACYGPEHVSAVAAYRALQDNNTSQRAILAHCQEEGISVVEYLHRREAYIRENGLSLGAV